MVGTPSHPTVRQTVDAYLAAVGDRVDGLYLFGSVALAEQWPEAMALLARVIESGAAL